MHVSICLSNLMTFDLRRLHAGRFGQGRRRSAKSVKRSTNTEPWTWRWWTLNQEWWSLTRKKTGIQQDLIDLNEHAGEEGDLRV